MSEARKTIVIAVLLAAATAVIYLPVRHHPFLNLDDNEYVTENLHVQDGLTWPTVTWAFTTYHFLNWHPVTWLSHALDVEMFGLEPAGPHVVNLLLHVVNVVLLFLVLQRATGALGRSAIVAALFALHPVNVESVAWIAERKNLLSMLFFLCALGAYGWYARRPAIGRYAVVAACFALGLMTKPQVITLPCVLLLWDYWPLDRVAIRSSPFAFRASPETSPLVLRRKANSDERTPKSDWRTLLLEKTPLFALCAASAFPTIRSQQVGGGLTSFAKYTVTVRLENALVAYARYLGKAFWPTKLTLMYPHPGNSIRVWQAALALLLLLGITELALRYREHRYLLVGWLWFLGTLVPMIGIVQIGHQAMADRYAYLPFIGLFIMVCWGLPDLVRRLGAAGTSRRSFGAALPALSVVVLLALALATHRQLGYWRDNLTLWSHANDVLGPNLIAEERMGDELLKRGQPAAALQHFLRAAAIQPFDPDSNFDIAVYEQKQGNLLDAIQRYQTVVAHAANPLQRARALMNMSHAYRDLGDSERARASLEAADALRR